MTAVVQVFFSLLKKEKKVFLHSFIHAFMHYNCSIEPLNHCQPNSSPHSRALIELPHPDTYNSHEQKGIVLQ